MSFAKDDILVIEPMDEHTVVNNTEKDHLHMAFKINYQADDLFWS